MSTINPPLTLSDRSNQYRVDYIQDISSRPEFDYPQVWTDTGTPLDKSLFDYPQVWIDTATTLR